MTQREGLYLICYYHLEILIAINDTYLEWIEPKAYLRICMIVTSTQSLKVGV